MLAFAHRLKVGGKNCAFERGFWNLIRSRTISQVISENKFGLLNFPKKTILRHNIMLISDYLL